ncbi:GumC family protein [Granulosicoccus antarcticus]|uniref:non-specific protein-tyrosine kinase n=1 Tax=Granulosicoccus antarcticus IMCC3135 TaxID=1192854 RepID=A0A2Z2P213_9GAMM|nr:polysaccharide biosynthesis tyrosine autokinase [Granulosicoccus antarcticus]ASJ74547.1 Tyrosine-protein kinase ptk [Granulosicoccus antarcticus IMCC3135]
MARSTDVHPGADSFDSEYRDDAEGGLDQIDLQHYVRILRKHKLPIILFTAAITGLAGYYAYTATPEFKATSTLLIESQANTAISFEELVGAEVEGQDYYETQYELLKSRGLAKRVVDVMGLWKDPELSSLNQGAESDAAATGSSGLAGMVDGVRDTLGMGMGSSAEGDQGVVVDLDNPEASLASEVSGSQLSGAATAEMDRRVLSGEELPQFSVDLTDEAFGDDIDGQLSQSQQIVLANFMGRLSIEPVRKTKLVKVSYASSDPEHAAKIANAVSEQYIDSYLDAKLELTTRASSWLSERLTQLKSVLDNSENRLITFKQENGLVDVDGSVGRLNEQELLLATAELAQARSELASKADVYREVQALQGQPNLLGSIPAFQADPLVQGVKIDQGQAQRQLDELRNRYGDKHPRVVDAMSQLATLNLTLEGHVARVVGSVAKEYQLAQQRVASIEAKLSSGKNEIQAIGTKKFELDALDREVQTNRTIYDTFFSRITEAKSADGLETANARVADYAQTPVSPFKPKKQLIIALAALGSLILSMLMAFLYEQMDDTVKGTSDIEKTLGLKLLGILPLIKGGLFNAKQNLPLSPLEIPDKNRTFAESVNTARTAICLDDRDSVRKVITITSSIPGEGKSTASINLAYSLSQLERVLLIDCDMRRPTVAKAAGFDRNVKGLSNLIANTAPARDCIIRGVYEGAFDILPSGPLPEQPLELLSSKRFEKILEQLGNHYDRIVIDSAPTQAVSDALVLARLSDAVVYVVKSHETSMELIKRGIQRLRQVDAPLAGVLITQVDINKITAYGGDYYYQGYYDYYGYTEKGEKGERSEKRGSKLRLTQQELMHIRTDSSEVDLGLDYGNGASTQASAADTDEFDFTARIDPSDLGRPASGQRPAQGSGQRRRSTTQMDDDLDIV